MLISTATVTVMTAPHIVYVIKVHKSTHVYQISKSMLCLDASSN